MKSRKQTIWMLALAIVAVPLAAEAQYTSIDLTPSGFGGSYGYGISGGQQVGWGYTGGNDHALLWSGTADSAVDLNPSGFGASYGNGISGGQQVGCGGYWNTGGYRGSHALLWSGTAASAVDLNPSGFSDSVALGISGSQQVGYGDRADNTEHALLWSGTAASAVDLQSFLSSDYTWSEAQGIDANGNIVGEAWNNSTSQWDAILWVAVPVPEPATVSLLALGLGAAAPFLLRRYKRV